MGDEGLHGVGELHKWLSVISVISENTESLDLSQAKSSQAKTQS
jgi:hypothetical protein